MHRTHAQAVALVALAGLAAATFVRARGPLNPPAGAVASTYKTLSEVEPRTAINAANTPGDADSSYRITVPGSYYLTDNLLGETGKSCIEIAASNVTIDLMGFRILGSGGALDGIVAASGQSNITVRNGSVRTFGGDGVDLGLAANTRIIDVTARNCDGVGVVAGAASVLTRVVVDSNISGGIHSLQRCTLESCVASDNLTFGFQVNTGSTVRGCTAAANTGPGFTLETGCTITQATAYGNTDGITTVNGCSVIGCTTRANAGDGISVLASCLVLNNVCALDGNGAADGAAIHATGSGNRIEGNNCLGADRGIDIDSDDSIIVRNTCSANTLNWSIAANNIYGPILDRTAAATAAVNGNAAASTLGTTDANANFSY